MCSLKLPIYWIPHVTRFLNKAHVFTTLPLLLISPTHSNRTGKQIQFVVSQHVVYLERGLIHEMTSIQPTCVPMEAAPKRRSQDPFHKRFMSTLLQFCEYYLCSCMKDNYEIKSQFCTCHDILAVVTCAKSWPWSGIRFNIRAKRFFYKIQLWTHKSVCDTGPTLVFLPREFENWYVTYYITDFSLIGFNVTFIWDDMISVPDAINS